MASLPTRDSMNFKAKDIVGQRARDMSEDGEIDVESDDVAEFVDAADGPDVRVSGKLSVWSLGDARDRLAYLVGV